MRSAGGRVVTEAHAPDLSVLTGVRSGKRSYYREYVRSDERMQSAVRAMDSISPSAGPHRGGPARPAGGGGPRGADHLDAEWTLLALADGHLAGARPRFLVIAANGVAYIDEVGLPAVRRRRAGRRPVGAQRTDDTGDRADRWVRVPMTLEGDTVGALVALHRLPEGPEPSDVSVLRILANQAAVSLHTSEQYQSGLALHRRAQRLYDEATEQAQDLAVRTAELRDVETRLHVAHQRELIDAERHRIARELHDSVTQYVLSAGHGRRDRPRRGRAPRVGRRRDQRAAADREGAVTAGRRAAAAGDLRAAPAAHRHRQDPPGAAGRGAATPQPAASRPSCASRATSSRSRGDADHEIARAVGEALFNVAAHAQASRVIVRLRYQPNQIMVAVSDDGLGDPVELTRLLRLSRTSSTDGRHRGLVNIDARLADMGGTIAFRRARLGGVRVEMRMPLPLAETDRPALIDGLVSSARS